MIKDKEEALAATEIHTKCSFVVGPHGRVMEHHNIWRVTNRKTWKTRPNEFKLTIKWGLKTYEYFDQTDLGNEKLFTEKTCPAYAARIEYEHELSQAKGRLIYTL